MITRIGKWFTPGRRAWLYRLTTAAGGAALVYGVVDSNELASLVGLATALFGTGTAAANTSTKPEPGVIHAALNDGTRICGIEGGLKTVFWDNADCRLCRAMIAADDTPTDSV